MRRLLMGLVLLLGAGWALAHAELESASPARGAVLPAPPERVALRFTEPVETRFSLFKVYPLEVDLTLPAGAETLEGADVLRVNGLAGALVNEVLALRGDEDARVDTGPVDTEPRAREVVLALEDGLPPGAYVVMWRVLSTDTHATQGYSVFVVGGGGP